MSHISPYQAVKQLFSMIMIGTLSLNVKVSLVRLWYNLSTMNP